jgi:hypothetical protein
MALEHRKIWIIRFPDFFFLFAYRYSFDIWYIALPIYEIVALRKNFVDRPESYDSFSSKSCVFLSHEITRTVWGIFLHPHTQPAPKQGIKKFLRHLPTTLVPRYRSSLSLVSIIFASQGFPVHSTRSCSNLCFKSTSIFANLFYRLKHLMHTYRDLSRAGSNSRTSMSCSRTWNVSTDIVRRCFTGRTDEQIPHWGSMPPVREFPQT